MPEHENILTTKLAGVYVINRPVYKDDRGFFREIYQKTDLENQIGFAFEPVQANHSRSAKNTLRGIHIAPWHKLVTVMRGTVQQVVVDTRPESETFGQHISVSLGEDAWQGVFIPAGCGNAFLVTSDLADYNYLATDYWAPGKEKYVRYNDPDLAINWQTDAPLVSDKDLTNPLLKEVFPR